MAPQDTIEIKDVSGADFESILEYIYTDAVPQSVVSPQHALRLFRLADRCVACSLVRAPSICLPHAAAAAIV